MVDSLIYVRSTLRVCMNGEMKLSSSLIIWFEGCSGGPSRYHFFYINYLVNAFRN